LVLLLDHPPVLGLLLRQFLVQNRMEFLGEIVCYHLLPGRMVVLRMVLLERLLLERLLLERLLLVLLVLIYRRTLVGADLLEVH
jgi:hypothetical protein